MKKLFIAVLMTAAISTSAFATDVNKVSYRILSNFQTEFSEATQVEWSATSKYTKATFILADEQIEAFYAADGELIGVSRKVDIKKLPIKALQKIKKSFADYNIKEVIEFDQNGDKNYYVSLSKGDHKEVLQVSLYGNVTQFDGNKN